MANIFSVSTKDELMDAIASATGGDTIELAEGSYGSLSLIDGTTDFSVDFDAPVTIRSADPETPASFSWMDLRGISNLTFDGIRFDSVFTGAEIWAAPFKIQNSSDVTIRNSVFEGELASNTGDATADGFATGIGLTVGTSSNIIIENNEFSTWWIGTAIGASTNVEFTGNDIHSIRMDGMNLTGVKNILIENNYIHDFIRSPTSGDHADMIQFFTDNNTSPIEDIIIRDNVLDQGDGDLTQSIFMRNGAVDTYGGGVDMYYQNVLIENNTIYNSQSHGITVGEANELIIRDNSLIKVGDNEAPIIRLKGVSTSVVVEENIAAAIEGFSDQDDWTFQNNTIIQPSDYIEYFVTSSMGSDSGANGFIVIPDSLIEQLGAGSDRVQFSDAPDTLIPQFLVRSHETSGQVLVFDASLTVGPYGLVSENDAQFFWDFGDGSTATGRIVQHEFGAPGYHDVRLTVVAEDGTTAEAQFTAGIAGDDLLQFDAQAGLFEALAFGEETLARSSELPLQEGTDGYVLKLGGEGLQAFVGSEAFSSFFGTDEFEMSMSLKADSVASWGEVARIHTSLDVSVDQAGNIRVNLFLDDGSRVNMASQGIAVNDGALHDITIRFDGEAGFAEILIDDQVVASAAVSGSLGGGERALFFGNPWSGQGFDSELSAFTLKADSKDYPSGSNAFIGGAGPDTLTGGAGNDLLDGGAGIDIAVYSGSQSSYTLTLSQTTTTLTDRRPDGNGTDTLIDMELLDFDTEIPAMGGSPMNLDQFGGPVALNEEEFADLIALYIAYFDRAPDATGLYFWATAFSNGLTLEEIAARFDTSAETKALYPDGSSNAEFVQAVYNNVLGRDPDQGGFDFWLGHLDSGTIPREVFILRLLDGAQGTDIDYIENKVDIGIYFTVIKGMSNDQNGKDVMELFDGSQQSIENAIMATDQFHAAALDPHFGEFLMPLVGVLDNPFAVA